jgi:hypothetical protein
MRDVDRAAAAGASGRRTAKDNAARGGQRGGRATAGAGPGGGEREKAGNVAQR